MQFNLNRVRFISNTSMAEDENYEQLLLSFVGLKSTYADQTVWRFKGILIFLKGETLKIS